MPVGGKTGTGDNRLNTFASGGSVTSSRSVDRTATFAFFLGDRFYGTVTAYVAGQQAGHYDFTSALAVQVLRVLEPALMQAGNGHQPKNNQTQKKWFCRSFTSRRFVHGR